MYKILSVDDEPINQAIVEELFRTKFNVFLVASGEECLEKIHDIQPDLILLDVSMEGLDGYDTCRELKKNGDTQNIPVIFVSARGSYEDKIRAYAAGGYDYVIKPFNHQKLEIRINETINRPRQEDKISKLAENYSTQHCDEKEIIIQFLSACCTDTSLNQLGELLVSSCQLLSLNCIFQFRKDSLISNFSTKNKISPLESSLFEQTISIGHIFDFDSKTIITHPHISLLIKNMPIEDTRHFNKIKNIVELLTGAAESRLKSLANEVTLSQHSELIIGVINRNLHAYSQHSGIPMGDLISEIQENINKRTE